MRINKGILPPQGSFDIKLKKITANTLLSFWTFLAYASTSTKHLW